MNLDVWEFDLSLSLISVLFFGLSWGASDGFARDRTADRRLFPTPPAIASYSRIWPSCFFREARLIAFVPRGPELSFDHLMYRVVLKIVCVCFVRLFCLFILVLFYLF